MRPKISIITVVWNGAAELSMTLEALSALRYDNVELIVIDGGSTDGTVEVIAQHASAIHYYVSEPDGGLYDAMNKGLRAATGEYVWFVNAGDLPGDERVLERIFVPDERYADVYFGEAMIVSEEGETLGLRRKVLPEVLTWRSLQRGMVVCHQAFIVRRSLAVEYDLRYRYVADIDWVIKCLRLAESVQRVEGVVCRFALGGISSQRRRASLRERWTVMRRHYGVWLTFWAHVGFVWSGVVDSVVGRRFR